MGSGSGRRLLQRLGTEVMRKRDPDYWVKAWIIKAEEARKAGFNVCVADCRFRNEAEVILANGGELVFCDYHSNRYDAGQAHESEHLAQRMLALGLKDGDAVMAGLL